GGASEFVIARFNPDGTLDATWDSATDFLPAGVVNVTFGTGVFGGAEFATDLALQPDGRLIVVGYTDNVNGVAAAGGQDFAVCRLNTNGSLDGTFGGGTGKVTADAFASDNRATTVAVQADGK